MAQRPKPKRPVLTPDQRRARRERARELMAGFRSDDSFMRELAEGIERAKRGEGVSWSELKRKRARR